MKIILLDVGNVLLTVDFSGFCKTLAGGDPALEKVIEQRYCRGLHKEDLDSGKTTPAQFFQTVASDPDTADIGLEAIEAHWVDLFTVIEDAPASVETLKSRYTVWIASDTDPAHFRHYSQRYPFIGQNDRFLLSFELGVMKHDSAFFDAVLASSGRPPEDFVLIDDKPVNCRSANSRGIDAILFQSWHATLQRLGLEKDGVR